MAPKAYTSDITWRSEAAQIDAIRNAMGVDYVKLDNATFKGADEIHLMLRLSRRNGRDTIYVASLAVLAANQREFRTFLKQWRGKGAAIYDAETITTYDPPCTTAMMIDAWRRARRNGAAKAGGEATAEKSEREFWEGFAKIKDRWHLPSKGENASKPLLNEAGTSRNTARSYLGFTREEWQRLSEAKRKRILEKQYGK